MQSLASNWILGSLSLMGRPHSCRPFQAQREARQFENVVKQALTILNSYHRWWPVHSFPARGIPLPHWRQPGGSVRLL
jgi:hypothetical protein